MLIHTHSFQAIVSFDVDVDLKQEISANLNMLYIMGEKKHLLSLSLNHHTANLRLMSREPETNLRFGENTYPIHRDDCPLPVFILQCLRIQLKKMQTFILNVKHFS